ncbi:MAG: polyamine aminopropyltransferase [Mycoplasmatales bacterium]
MNLWFSEKWTDATKFSIKYEERLISKKSKYQKIDFYRSKEWGTFFTLDDLFMVTEKDEFIYHDMIVHPAMAVNPKIQKVLVIGGGDGGTVRELTRYKTITTIDMVEIDEEVVKLCQKFIPQTASQLVDKRVNLFFEDGVAFVNKAQTNSYDLILVDSTDPIGPGEGLFTTAFYQNCYRILNDNGILINQHESPYFEQYAQEMLRSHGKLKNIFPIAKVYQFHQAIYPSGHWLFGFASKNLDPLTNLNIEQWKKFNLHTRYYNPDIHLGAFMLPTYVKEMLQNKENKE